MLVCDRQPHLPSQVHRLPSWFKQEIPEKLVFSKLNLLLKFNLHTVCQEARCPNLGYCFKNNRLTFLILGDTCTRNCRFCAVTKAIQKNLPLDALEPQRIASAVKELALGYVVITSVTRDDLSDGGAEIFAQTIRLIYQAQENTKVEVLIPDFQGRIESLQAILDAGPQVIAHNLETVNRLYPQLRPMADYFLSLDLLKKIKKLSPQTSTKSSLMLGLGEEEGEVILAMQDLRKSQCDCLTLGQYLAPSKEHYPVKAFIHPEQFAKYRKVAQNLGFKSVLSGPLVRSSYQAEELLSYV